MPHRSSITDTDGSIASDRHVLLSVDRAVSDLRRGAIVVLRGTNQRTVLVMAAEGATSTALERLRSLSGGEPALVITGRRALALGLNGMADQAVETEGPSDDLSDAPARAVILSPTGGLTAWLAAEMADPLSETEAAATHQWRLVEADPGSCESAAIGLAKVARMLPASIVAPLNDRKAAQYPVAWAEANDLLVVESQQIFDYEEEVARSLHRISDARVPLEGAEDTRIISFRPGDGGIEHLAILIGNPTPGDPVLLRLHSECFTGDLLGSLRCDCGDQLRGAIAAIAEAGSGVLLYLAQEGRGIGLVNKLRAYELQDRGGDTLEANETLGFDADERVYLPAAEMLRQLGFDQVRLMTNNPDKVAALSRYGVTVVERVPHRFPSNPHNLAYLTAKAVRGGHMF